uniref:Tick transposon n=1 Tax=Rhipicephalus appendiculatus TaxID=34631 RepID=A0A131YDK3_RHIAP
MTPCDTEGDFLFLGLANVVRMPEYQREDNELLSVIRYVQGDDVVVPRLLSRGLASSTLRNNVLYKRNFENRQKSFLLVVPTALRAVVLQTPLLVP